MQVERRREERAGGLAGEQADDRRPPLGFALPPPLHTSLSPDTASSSSGTASSTHRPKHAARPVAPRLPPSPSSASPLAARLAYLPADSSMLVLALHYDDTSMAAVLRRWKATVLEEEPAAERHAVKVVLSRKLSLQAVAFTVERLESLKIDVESMDLEWNEVHMSLVEALPRASSPPRVALPRCRADVPFAHADPTRLALSFYGSEQPTSPLSLSPWLEHLDLRNLQQPRLRHPLPLLTTLLLHNAKFSSGKDWLDVLQACPALEELGSSGSRPMPSSGIFTATHLPPSLAHICFDDPFELDRSSFDFLHDLPPTVQSVTVTQLGHYKAKERKIAPLRWACSRKGIELTIRITGLRHVPLFDLEVWAARN